MRASIGVFAPISPGVLFLRRRSALKWQGRSGPRPKDRLMKGKTIVATGATSGIGEAAVLELAGMGARIVIVARDEARAQATMRKLEAKAPGLEPSRASGGSLEHGRDAQGRGGDRRQRAAHRRADQQRRRPLFRAAGDAGRPRADLRAQPHGLFRADRGAARQARRLGAGADRLHLLDAHTRARASISTTCRAPRATAGSRSTAARSSPISCSPANSPVASPERE